MYHSKLWQSFIDGDKKVLATIFRSFYEELFNYGIKLTGSKDITEDGLQDLFLKLWINRKNLPDVKNTKAYLFTSFRHILFDNLKWYNRKDTKDLPKEDIFDVEFSHEDILIRNSINTEIREKLLNAINSLSSRQKEAIFLRYFINIDFDDIASIMEVNVQSVRNFIHRGLIMLRELDIKK